MTKQPTPETTDRQSVETIERIAGVLAELSSELTEISARLRSQTEATERDDPGREATNRTREPLSGARQRVPVSRAPTERSRSKAGQPETARTAPARTEPARTKPATTGPARTEITLGEPVDTSFVLPARVPAATAAGSASGSAATSGATTGSPGRGGRFRALAGFAGSVGLFGLVVVVTVALTRGWYAPLAQVLAGALLGAALFAGALWLHHKSTGRPV